MGIPGIQSQNSVWSGSWSGVCAMSVMLWTLSAGATESTVPWECTGFTGEAHNRCMRTFTELHQEKIEKLEKDLEVQKQKIQQLQQQVGQQASATAELERQLTQNRSRWYGSPSVHVYPPVGLSLHYGRDRFYGNPRYFGPRFHGHRYRRWHRH